MEQYCNLCVIIVVENRFRKRVDYMSLKKTNHRSFILPYFTKILSKVMMIIWGMSIVTNTFSQDVKYQKDDRPLNIKEDKFSYYQNPISEIDLLKVLEMLGVKIFDTSIFPVFEKEYNLSVNLDEYVEGEKINSNDIIYTPGGKNIYIYWVKDSIEQKDVRFFDYIPKLTFITKDSDTTMIIDLHTYANNTRGIKLKKNKTRDYQFYDWRSYSKIDWKLNEEVPFLVYASSWYDEQIKGDRFCGVADLSMDEKETKELLTKSPHYYVISLKVFE